MYSYWGLYDREAFEALELELERPIRFIPLGASGMVRPFDDYLGDNLLEVTANLANSIGITVTMGGRIDGSSHGIRTYRHNDVTYEGAAPESAVAPITVFGDFVIGEVRQRRVHLYVTWPHYTGYDDENDTVIRDAVIEAIKLSVEPTFVSEWDAREAESRREALREFIQRTYDATVNQRRGRIDELTSSISEMQNNLARMIRSVRQEDEQLRVTLAMRESDTADKALREWSLIENHPRVANTTYEPASNELIVTTTDDVRMTREDTGESRWLGAFEIRYNLTNLSTTINNLNTRRGGRDHPHVGGGVPCYGGHAATMSELMARGELYTKFELDLQYLEQINLRDSWGAYASYWFEVPDERPIEEEVTA